MAEKVSVSMMVADQIKSLGPKVEEKVVGAMVERELTRRTDALVKAMDALTKLEKDFFKLGADIVTYDEAGKETAKSYSKARIEARTKEQKKIDRHKSAINKALENGDFGDLYNVVAGKDGGDDSASKASSEG